MLDLARKITLLSTRKIFWIWLAALIFMNTYPFGESTSVVLSGNKLIFRLDYLLHATLILVFAWVYVWGRIRNENAFHDYEVFWVIAISLFSAVCLEGIQVFLPYRKFNPLDMLSNVIGALTGSLVILLSYRISLSK